jgi:hypothetical protein
MSGKDGPTRRALHLPYAFGQVVYHRMSGDKSPGMVTGFHVRATSVLVAVTWSDRQESSHYDFELTTELNPDLGIE